MVGLTSNGGEEKTTTHSSKKKIRQNRDKEPDFVTPERNFLRSFGQNFGQKEGGTKKRSGKLVNQGPQKQSAGT